METREYKIRGRKEDLEVIENLLAHMQYLGHIGASRNLVVRVDGDGDGRIKVEGLKEPNKKYTIEQYSQPNYGYTAVYDIG